MALRVEKALIEGTHLVVEAGTGTGKTLAYLYPSLRFSLITGRRIHCLDWDQEPTGAVVLQGCPIS